MIYLLYGSDTKTSQKKLNEIIAEYRKKHGDLNIHKFDAEENGAGKIKEALETNSLFSTNKLVVIKHLSNCPERDTLYKIFESLKNLKDAVVVLWERELRAKESVELKEYCDKAQEFSARGGSAFGGKNLKGLSQFEETTVFHLGDTFFTDKRAGLRHFLSLLHQGHDDFNLFSYLSNHCRTLLTVKSYAEKGQAVPPSAGIHPYVAKKAAMAIRSHTTESLARIFKKFFREDLKIKTGLSKPKESLTDILLEK